MTLAERMKAWRLEKGLTQKQMGALVGVSDCCIGRFERGCDVHKSYLPKLAKVMGCKIRDLE